MVDRHYEGVEISVGQARQEHRRAIESTAGNIPYTVDLHHLPDAVQRQRSTALPWSRSAAAIARVSPPSLLQSPLIHDHTLGARSTHRTASCHITNVPLGRIEPSEPFPRTRHPEAGFVLEYTPYAKLVRLHNHSWTDRSTQSLRARGLRSSRTCLTCRHWQIWGLAQSRL